MRRRSRLLQTILSGRSDANIRFNDLLVLLRRMGFDERIRGSHHIFTKDDLDEVVNVQPQDGQVKPYQVRQIRQLILRYELEEVN